MELSKQKVHVRFRLHTAQWRNADRNLHQLLQVVAPDVKFRSLYLGEPQLHGVLHKVFVSTYDESCIVNEQEEFDRFECRDHGIGQATVEVVDEYYKGLNSCFLKELTEILSEFSYITAHSIGLFPEASVLSTLAPFADQRFAGPCSV